MNYDNRYIDLDEAAIYFDDLILNIKNIDLGSDWSGDASSFMTESLLKSVDDFYIQNDNLKRYNKALGLMARYI